MNARATLKKDVNESKISIKNFHIASSRSFSLIPVGLIKNNFLYCSFFHFCFQRLAFSYRKDMRRAELDDYDENVRKIFFDKAHWERELSKFFDLGKWKHTVGITHQRWGYKLKFETVEK